MKVKANVLLAKCNSKDMFGMRVQYMENDWYRTWAFRIKSEMATKEGFDKVNLNGSFYSTEEYPGCPYCGRNGFYVCGCGKLNCWDGSDTATCNWCGSTSNIVTSDSLDVTGGGY